MTLVQINSIFDFPELLNQVTLTFKGHINLDNKLWNEFRDGNAKAFAEIYQRNIKCLLRYGLRITNNREMIKDCIQELFVELHNRRKTLGETDNIKPYLIVSLKRKLIRAIHFRYKFIPLDDEIPFRIEYQAFESDLFEKNELSSLHSALKKLSSRQKEALYLRYFENLDYNDISKLLNLTYQSSRNLIHRAIEKLRELTSLSTTGIDK